MGSDDVYAKEGPPRETRFDGFRIDPHEVTNRQFAAFVAANSHVTVAERLFVPAALTADAMKPGNILALRDYIRLHAEA